MAHKAISWILKFTSELPNEEEKIKCLRANGTTQLKTILKYAFDPAIEWDLPEGSPPYKVNEYPHQEHLLYTEARRLYLFLKGGSPNLKQLKKEMLFIELLQTVDPEDAKMLISIKDKSFPYSGLDVTTVKKAFPDLI